MLAVLFDSPVHIRNWINQDILKENNVKYFCFQHKEEIFKDKYRNIEWNKIVDIRKSKIFETYTYCQLLEHRKLSKSYKYWVIRMWRSDLKFYAIWEKKLIWKQFQSFMRSILTKLPFHVRAIRNMVIKFYLLHVRKLSKDLIAELNLQLKGVKKIMVPCSGFEPWMPILLTALKELKIESIVQIDNWDNLSSKSYWTIKPDKILVFGEQMKDHAIKIHGFLPETIFVVGTPRMELLSNINKRKPVKNQEITIVYCGNSLINDESAIMKKLGEITQRILKSEKRHVKIIYRPHPKRKTVDVLKRQKYNSLDKKIENKLWDDLTYDFYQDIINADLCIVSPSSVILECMILEKKIIIESFKSHSFFTNSYNNLRNFEHFREIVEDKVIPIANDSNEIEELIYEAIIKDSHHIDKNYHTKFIAVNKFSKQITELFNN